MEFITIKENFYAIGIAFAGFILIVYKKRGAVFLITAAIIVGLNDLISHQILKEGIMRPRPCHVLPSLELVPCSNSFSFPSNHASNMFTAVTLMSLCFRNTTLLAYSIAIIVGYSRVYLGVHYPSDVLGGAVLGIGMGFLGYWLYRKILAQIGAVPESLGTEVSKNQIPKNPPPIDAPPGQKILILKFSSLGDIVHTLPALSALRQEKPQAYIAWMIEEQYQEILDHNPDLDEVIPIRTQAWRKKWSLGTLAEIFHTVKYIRKRKFDVAYDAQGLVKSGVAARLSGAPQRIGFHPKDCKEPFSARFTNHKRPYTGARAHIVDLNIALLLGHSLPSESSRFPLPATAEGRVEDFLKAQPDLLMGPVAGINAGVGFASKRWAPERFAALADKLAAEEGYAILLTWGPGEKKLAEEIGGRMKQAYHLAPATSIRESIALYRHLALLVSCDSGPLHICAALGIPTVALFGPTDPKRNGPYRQGGRVVCKILECSFCWKKTCPLGTGECMDQITVTDVIDTVKRTVAGNRTAATL